MRFLNFCNRIIEYSFYALFLFVPLAFTSKTSELFELNKMWLVWGLTVIIGMSWAIKMVLQKKIIFQRTPLDIPIGLFLVSQIISTIFSLDSHTSFWGYYSRFNGGLLSIISHILLYYAFVEFVSEGVAKEERGGLLLTGPRFVKRLLKMSLISGLIVALWGLPSHFGYDPTCLLFRGKFDVSCWTADFLPKVRIFSTLGQPDWLAAYLAILIPISITYGMKEIGKSWLLATCHLLLATLFYVDLLYTRARSGFVGISLALIAFAALYYWISGKPKISISAAKLKSPLAILVFGFLIATFFIGTPINQLNKFTLAEIGNYFQKVQAPKTTTVSTPAPAQPINLGGTESGDIRMLVWEGAINTWKANPIFGTGVETFAFAYYKYKPIGQNLTSEWNFLYNKAHNEYLNYLATTGIIGLGTYLLMISSFIFVAIKDLRFKIKDSKFLILNHSSLIIALLASYISILITNFFGFSVVITNVYLFMIPAFVFTLNGMLSKNESGIKNHESGNIYQWTGIFFIIIASLFMILNLFRFWQADIAFALGYNLDRAGEYQQAYPNLHKAVGLRESEPVFRDELSVNNAIIAAGLVSQKPSDSTTSEQTISVASSLTQEAINISNGIVSQYPNNVVFWKTRVRLFHTLSQVDSRYLPRALDAIEKASLLAPNDANIRYNLGVLYGQNNNLAKGIEALEKTIELKPNYREAYYALGLFYHTQALDETGKIIANPALQEKAIAQMRYILEHLSSKDADALKSLADWSSVL